MVDHSGQLVDNVSSKDLAQFLRTRQWSELTQPISTFLTRLRSTQQVVISDMSESYVEEDESLGA